MAAPPRLSVRNLQVTPVYARPRQAVNISARVVNDGGSWGSGTIELLLNGQFEQSVAVGVSPGTSRQINLTVYRVEPGTYQVAIGEASGTFYVAAEAVTPTPAGGLLAGGELDTSGIIAIVCIGIILFAGIAIIVIISRPA